MSKRQLGPIVIEKSERLARDNRRRIESAGAFALNLIGSPGSGKTTLLEATIARLQHPADGAKPLRVAVIEGDVQTTLDRDRIRKAGGRATQIQTGGACRLDAAMVAGALPRVLRTRADLLFIENVGNLICPSALELGEHAKVAVLSIPEGDEKPAKYPTLFLHADAVVFTKLDLLPHVEYDLKRAVRYCRRLNPRVRLFQVSARTGEGIGEWISYLRGRAGKRRGRELR